MNDSVGERTLKHISEMDRFNSIMFDRIEPFLGNSVLEVGCGIGNITKFFGDRRVVGVDINDKQLAEVRKVLGHGIFLNQDIVDMDVEKFRRYNFDTVVCLNVLEHIKRDSIALRKMFDVLESGGRAILLVPAGNFLYNNIDRNLDHCRRYSRTGLVNKMKGAGFVIEKVFYFNLFGVLPWYIHGNVLGRKALPGRGLKLFNKLAPLMFGLERLVGSKFGLSLVVVGRKK